MKILRKNHIRKKNQIQRTNTERHILEYINHPFIVRLKYAFQNKKKL
jgi:serine/threonine protein kinase